MTMVKTDNALDSRLRLSIVIVNWNTSQLLQVCLESIYRYPPEFGFEVLVVDNASTEFDETAMRSQFPHATFIVNQFNLGYAEGNNQAIAHSRGKYVLLLNPDTELKDDALAKLVQFMDTHPDAGAAGCRLVRPNGTIDRSCRSLSVAALDYTSDSRHK
jgi:GT2 family glycosyltransferase